MRKPLRVIAFLSALAMLGGVGLASASTRTASTSSGTASDHHGSAEAAVTQCSDGIDNDDDGGIDFGGDHADPDCTSPDDNTEAPDTAAPQCSDGIDNDDDGLSDFGSDPGCESADDNDETDPAGHRCADPDGLAGAGGGGTIAEQVYHGVLEGTPLDGSLVTEPVAGGALSEPLYDEAQGSALEALAEEIACVASALDSGAL